MTGQKKNVKKLQNTSSCKKKRRQHQTKYHSNARHGAEKGSFTDTRYNLPREHHDHKLLCAPKKLQNNETQLLLMLNTTR